MPEHFNYLVPVEEGAERPLWSVMIPTYNCAHYLRETLESVLCQDPGPQKMQIEVIDDGSFDDPETVVNEVGKGRVVFFRQSKNVGHTKNFETALYRSRGHLIHLLHGDDRVLWGFYSRMEKLFRDFPDIGAGFCRHYYMDENGDQGNISALLQPRSGIMNNFLEKMMHSCLVQTPSMVVKRSVYEDIGMFDHRLLYTEDYEMWCRIGSLYPVGYCKTPLAEYRMHGESNTGRTERMGKALEDKKRAMQIITAHGKEKQIEYLHYFNSNIIRQELEKAHSHIAHAQKKEAREVLAGITSLGLNSSLRWRWFKAYIKSYL